ncbi:MAG: histidine kinase [Burkholderiales bacterium]|nr:histidine kinase [Burkholderiales bacterium]
MATDTSVHADPPTWKEARRDMLRWFVRVLVMNTFIAVALWAGGMGPFDQQMVYSQSIGLSIWLILNSAAVLWSRKTGLRGLPRGGLLVALMAVAIVGGFLIGTRIGNAYAGSEAAFVSSGNPRLMAAMFLMTVAVGIAATYHFYAESRGAELSRALAQTERQAAEARLTLLQSQLEPHMLFNTLANLRALIATDPPQAITMLDQLNDYLRATLSASRQPMHPLENEFDRLRDYLALMSVRMGDRLRVRLDLPDDLRAWPVPTLLLQPLVENCIKHGLTHAPGGGEIVIRAERSGTLLALEVSDTGVGLPPDFSSTAAGGGFGLAQVRERLATTYGDGATMSIAANSPHGTVVRIALPPAA